MNETHLLKAMGHLPSVEAKDLDTAMVNTSPAVKAMIKSRKCFTPDFGDEEIARSTDAAKLSRHLHLDDEDDIDEVDGSLLAAGLIISHRRLLNRTSGSGSWQAGCDPDYPDRHVATFYVDYDSFPNNFFHEKVSDEDLEILVNAKVWGTRKQVFHRYKGKTNLRAAIALMVETFRRAGLLMKEVDDPDNANVLIGGKRIPGSTIGYAYFNNTRCDDQVECWLDTSYQPGLVDFVQLLSHEIGHTDNLEHEFFREERHRSIMSYADTDVYWGFSTGEEPYGLPRDHSWDDLIRHHGDEPFPADAPDNPDPEPVPDVPAGVPTKLRALVDGKWYDYLPEKPLPSPPDDEWKV